MRPASRVLAVVALLAGAGALVSPASGEPLTRSVVEVVVPPPPMREGVWQLSYVARGASEAPFEVFVTRYPAGSVVGTTWAFPTAPLVTSAAFDAATRSLLDVPEAHSFVWLNHAELEAGKAMMGYEEGVRIASTPLGEAFATPTSVYVFEPVHGFLVAAMNAQTGTTIKLASLSPAPAQPGEFGEASDFTYSPLVLDVPLQRLVDPGSDEAQGILESLAASIPPRLAMRASGAPDAICGGAIRGPLAGDYEWQCAAHRPAAEAFALSPADCPPGFGVEGVPRPQGTHTIEGFARFDACLNPRSGFTCSWDVSVRFRRQPTD